VAKINEVSQVSRPTRSRQEGRVGFHLLDFD